MQLFPKRYANCNTVKRAQTLTGATIDYDDTFCFNLQFKINEDVVMKLN